MTGGEFFDWLNKYWPLIGFLLQGAFAWLLWSMRKVFATKEELATLGKKVDKVAAAQTVTAGELVGLSKELKNLPTAAAVSDIKLSIAAIEGDYKAISTNVDNMDRHITSIGKSVDRIEDWLMNGKGKGA